MKKLLLALTVSAPFTVAAGSFQLGTVTELSISHDRVTFQLDTSADNIDIRANCLDAAKPLNLVIDLSKPGGQVLYNAVVNARKDNSKLAVNGDGVCLGDEFEGVDTINL